MRISPLDLPVDFSVAGTLVVGAIIDYEFITVCQCASFVETTILDTGAFETETRAH